MKLIEKTTPSGSKCRVSRRRLSLSPEIPSDKDLAGSQPSECEPVHKSLDDHWPSFFFDLEPTFVLPHHGQQVSRCVAQRCAVVEPVKTALKIVEEIVREPAERRRNRSYRALRPTELACRKRAAARKRDENFRNGRKPKEIGP